MFSPIYNSVYGEGGECLLERKFFLGHWHSEVGRPFTFLSAFNFPSVGTW